MIALGLFIPPRCVLDGFDIVPPEESVCLTRIQSTVRINVALRYGDMTYFPLGGTARVWNPRNISPRGPQVVLDAEGYLAIFDDLLPAPGEETQDMMQTLLFRSCSIAIENLGVSNTVLLLPLYLQQFFDPGRNESQVSARFCKPTYRVIVASRSFWIFTAVATFVLLSCSVVLAWLFRVRSFNLSSFPDFDLLAQAQNLNLNPNSLTSIYVNMCNSRFNRTASLLEYRLTMHDTSQIFNTRDEGFLSRFKGVLGIGRFKLARGVRTLWYRRKPQAPLERAETDRSIEMVPQATV